MHPSLRYLDHRPWPLPTRAWTLQMAWLDLAFIHYPIDAGVIRPLLPADIRIDEFDGTAWLGLVPFRMADIRPRLLPRLPFLNTFPEINVRTYVEVGGKRGVWFFSLDADSWPAVFGGRQFLDLAYFSAHMQLIRRDGWFELSSVRRTGAAVFRGRYRPAGHVFLARPGTFEHWATERYCLYAHSPRRGLARQEVHHAPWPLHRAEVEIDECSLVSAAGIVPGRTAPLCHFSSGVDVVAFARQPL